MNRYPRALTLHKWLKKHSENDKDLAILEYVFGFIDFLLRKYGFTLVMTGADELKIERR